jgi:arabinose-5-phosphate isomerase
MAATFNSTAVPAVVLNSVDALHGDLGIINDGDIVLALSYSGESDEIINLISVLKRFNVKIIAMTGHSRSTVAKLSDIILNVKVPREACPFNLAPTSSTTAMLVMGDALAMAILKARNIKRDDFAKYHPSGAIGRALLMKVNQIMRTGDRLPVVRLGTTVRDSLIIMTKAKAGCVGVVDGKGKLVGIFTDGDLRRRMADTPDLLSQAIESVMTKDPVTVREDALAVEALKIFKSRNIDDLLVVNSKKELVGIVDSQDLPRLKIV